MRRRAVVAFGLTAVMVASARADEFRLELQSGASETALEPILQAARAHRRLRPNDAIVIVLPPRLWLTAPIVLGPEDSGQDDAPLVLRGGAAAGSTVSGARAIESQARPDIPPALRARLPAGSADRVRRAAFDADIAARTAPSIAAGGSFEQSGSGRLVVFEGDLRLQPAQWPSSGYFHSPLVSADAATGRPTLKLRAPIAGLEEERDLWVDGFWGWNWWFERRRANAKSPQAVEFDKPMAPFRPSARYRLINLAAGLDRDGVYYRDVADGSLDFLPQANDGEGRLFVAVADSLLRIEGAAHIRIENVAFEKTIGAAVSIENSSDIVLRDCYVGQTGTHGVVISGGENDRIEDCVIDDVGYSGVVIAGGDRATLAPGRHVLRRSSVSHFGREMPTYEPGVALQGVGNRVEDCEIAYGPHAGIIFGGNDHVIEGNLFHDLALDSDDAGAIYSGRNWTTRGTVIASNFFHDITDKVGAGPVVGVYLDDQLSGATAEGNVFRGVDEPILVGGGRDNVVRDNLLLAWRRGPIALDARGLGWQAAMAQAGGSLTKSLNGVPLHSALWEARYPALARLADARPGAPLDNRFLDNLADRMPVVAYDRPQTALYGEESGSRRIDPVGIDFPVSLAGLPADAPAAQALAATAARVIATEQAMQALSFRWRLAR